MRDNVVLHLEMFTCPTLQLNDLLYTAGEKTMNEEHNLVEGPFACMERVCSTLPCPKMSHRIDACHTLNRKQRWQKAL